MLWYGKAPPGWGGGVSSMKLLAPGVGWAERGGRLYWTADNGTNWKDITPPIQGTADVFFLDTHRGWATPRTRHSSPSSDELQFDVASTTDAGATWSVIHPTLSLKDQEMSHSDVSDYQSGPIAFADAVHGWMSIQTDGLTMNSWSSFLLITSDGGRTWHSASDSPEVSEPNILLVTANDGWMAGGQDVPSEKLYVTRDGAKSWKEISLKAPKEVLPADQPAYDLPIFEGSKRGFVAVTYSGGYGISSAAVLFATVDGGRTWNLDRILKDLEPDNGGHTLLSSLAGSTWITAVAPDRQTILSTLGPGARINANISAGTERWLRFQPRKLSMVSPRLGWILAADGELLSTTDGGATWITLSPGPQPHVIQPHGSFVPRQSMRSSTAAAPSANPPSVNDSSGQNVSPH